MAGSVAVVVLLAAAWVVAGRRHEAAPPRVSARPPVASSVAPRTWSPTYMAENHSYTQDEAVALARRFDIVAGLPTAFKRYSAAMHSANPALKLLVYTNGMFATPAQAPTMPADWFALDGQGRRITSAAFGNFLMDPASTGWRTFSVQQCRDRAKAGGYDGCIVDMLTMAVFAPRYVSALPFHAAPSRAYTPTEWRDALLTLAKEFAATPDLLVAGNTVTSTNRFLNADASSQPVSEALQLAQAEDFLRGSGDVVTAFPDARQWERNLEVVRDLEQAGTGVLVSTKLWVPVEAAARDQWQRFAMASFLMATDGRSYFAFTSARTPAGAAGTDDRYTLPKDLGRPLAAAHAVGALTVREFEAGVVVVNPGDSPAALSTDRALRDLDGAQVTSSTVAPHDATVLRGTGAVVRAG